MVFIGEANNPFMTRSSFSDDAVPLPLLRERAFNLRWAQLPEDVIPLTAADPDFPACPAVREQLARYASEGVLSYGPPEGLPRFREAVSDWMCATRQMECTPGMVFATDSAASAMAVVARASLKPGDEAIIPAPVDFLLQHTITRAGATPVPVAVTRETTAEEFIARLEAARTPRTRMLWLCSPHNPLGVVYSREWLQAVADWAVRRGLRILADEIWSDIVYCPHQHTAMQSLSREIAERTVTVYGFSKNFALAGLRIGCVICADRQWREAIVAAADAESTVFGTSVLSQVAVIAALRDGSAWLAEFVAHLTAQRDYAVERLSRWPGVTVSPPHGTYVVFPCIRNLDEDAERFCLRLRDQARVALVPGLPRWFGEGAGGHVRVCFATSRGILQEAFDRMEPVVKSLAADRRLS
jgi:cysteine-S-conjugate beta-lyase